MVVIFIVNQPIVNLFKSSGVLSSYIIVISIIEKVLNSPTTIMDLSIFPFSSVSIFFIYFEGLLSAYIFSILCLLDELTI